MISLNPITLSFPYITDAGAGTVSATKSSSKFASSFLGILKSSRPQAEDDALTRTWHSSSAVKSILRESSFHSIPSPPQPEAKAKAKEPPQPQSYAGSNITTTTNSTSSENGGDLLLLSGSIQRDSGGGGGGGAIKPPCTDQGKYLRLVHCNNHVKC